MQKQVIKCNRNVDERPRAAGGEAYAAETIQPTQTNAMESAQHYSQRRVAPTFSRDGRRATK